MPSLTETVKRAIPSPVLSRGQRFRRWVKEMIAGQLESRARSRFANSRREPLWLSPNLLPTLQRCYAPPPEYGYSSEQIAQRGDMRATELLHFFPAAREARDFLELGSGDAMVSTSLQRLGKRTTAVDMEGNIFDPRAADAGVVTRHMDASELQFPDQSFDFIFSYNAFEHFADPAGVLQQAARVLRPCGSLYLYFGPLAMSPLGLHAYRIITVPYCQFLFKPAVITAFAKQSGSQEEIPYCNGWSADAYRALWQSIPSLKIEQYGEERSRYGLELVVKYPSCFRGKTDRFENLLVSAMQVLFHKDPAHSGLRT